MKTLITYCTRHGCTEKVAKQIRDFLGDEATLYNLKDKKQVDPTTFDRIIIGGSIHAGQIQKKVKKFYTENLDLLLQKELGIFICCMEEGEKAEQELQDVFPDTLLSHAKATACLGGEFNFEKMNFLEKMIVRKVAKVDRSVSNIKNDTIRLFSDQMNRKYQPFFFLI